MPETWVIGSVAAKRSGYSDYTIKWLRLHNKIRSKPLDGHARYQLVCLEDVLAWQNKDSRATLIVKFVQDHFGGTLPPRISKSEMVVIADALGLTAYHIRDVLWRHRSKCRNST